MKSSPSQRVWSEHPRAMIVGLNPAQASVEAGPYYQGKSGQRQLHRLVSAEVLATQLQLFRGFNSGCRSRLHRHR